MTTIVNLSTLLTLKPISTSVNAFAQLCERYSNPSCCNISFINKSINTMWVWHQLSKHQKDLIEPYKLGTMSSDDFLKKLSEIFDFVEVDESSSFTKKQHEDKIIAAANQYFSLQNPEYKNSDLNRALLEDAWGAMIEVQQQDIERLKQVLSSSHNKPVYLISNTNELHVFKYLSMVKAMAPELNWKVKAQGKAKEMLHLGNQVYLVPSYLQHAYKTDAENKQLSVTTPDMLSRLLESVDDKSETIVISQYAKDLERAQQLGVPKENTQSADDYFAKPTEKLKKTM